MRSVVNEYFLHIHTLNDKSLCSNKHSEKWKVGNKISIGKDKEQNKNVLFDRVFNPLINFDYERKLIIESSKKYLKANRENLKRIKADFEENSFIEKYYQLVREIVFEEVRLEKFSEYPSRLNGIWLTDFENLPLWKNIIPVKQFNQKIFIIKLNGKIHKADSYLISKTKNDIGQFLISAEKYWKGENHYANKKPLYEYLCNGEIEIIEQIE